MMEPMDKENNKISRRGYDENDDRWFNEVAIKQLKTAQEEIIWLLDRGYKTSTIIEFVGGRYQFSARQRMALQRGSCSHEQMKTRIEKQLLCHDMKSECLFIDGFNLIITLEVALSGSILVMGNDGCLRDLAGLRGTYKIIDKTEAALELIGKKLEAIGAARAVFFLDAPVSNSGRLKSKILQLAENWDIPIEVELAANPDTLLSNSNNVVSSDSVILDQCKSWVNLSRHIIESDIRTARIVDLSNE